jgi:branched-chain amino acid transport system ATP-binding protein
MWEGPAMNAALLEMEGVTKRFGGFIALDTVSVAIRPGERFGLVGPNGSGKTTLINCISGVLSVDAGSISFKGENISGLPAYVRTRRGIARSFQIPRPFKSMTVIENLLVALDFAVVGHGLGRSERHGEVMSLLERMGLAGKAFRPSGELSQVELRRLELARAMAARPMLLISDETMAGLSSGEVDEVLDLLFKLNGDGITIIMIEHIMHAVMRFSERVMCLDAGRVIASGSPAEVMGDQRVQEAYLGAHAHR